MVCTIILDEKAPLLNHVCSLGYTFQDIPSSTLEQIDHGCRIQHLDCPDRTDLLTFSRSHRSSPEASPSCPPTILPPFGQPPPPNHVRCPRPKRTHARRRRRRTGATARWRRRTPGRSCRHRLPGAERVATSTTPVRTAREPRRETSGTASSGRPRHGKTRLGVVDWGVDVVGQSGLAVPDASCLP